MYSLDYVDESVIDACRKQFLRVYPEFRPHFLGACKNKQALIVECEFPDGTFYFTVTENSISSAYNTKEDADRE